MTGKELVKQLQAAGFRMERIQGSHHILKRGPLEVSVPVHAGRDLATGTLNKLLKQAGLK